MSLRDDAAHPVDAVHHDGRTGGTPLHLAAAAGAVPGLSAEGFRRLAAQLWVSLFVADLAGTIVYVNDAAARLLGRSREELLGLTIADISHPDDVEASRDRLREALREDLESYRITKRYVRGDGRTVVTDLTVSMLRDDDGRAIAFLAAAVDETERMAMQARAEAASAFLRATVDSLLDPWVYLVAVRDEHGTIVDFLYADANPAAYAHNHTTSEDLLGRRLLDLLPDHDGELLAQYAHVVDTGEPLAEDDVPFFTRGEQRYFSNRAVRIGADGLSLTWRDTTEQVALRRALTVQATTDPLTGMLNRAGLDEAARRLARDERRHSSGVAVLYIDLDGLGVVNREHGHPAGDTVLRAVADRLAGAVRSGDVVARVGGDEFVVLAAGVDDEGAGTLAIKLADAVTRPLSLEHGRRVVPSISVGVTVGTSDEDTADLVARADQAMLARKAVLYAGTDRYERYDRNDERHDPPGGR